MKICCICGELFSTPGCNPWPLKLNGVCCERCDDMKVTPARLIKRGVPADEAHRMGERLHQIVQEFKRKQLQP